MTTSTAKPYRKKAVPNAVRRELATRYGCPPGETINVACHYCGRLDHIVWWRNPDGKPGCWVSFGHEIDHVIPEVVGGPTIVENLVLACRTCNRRKGARV